VILGKFRDKVMSDDCNLSGIVWSQGLSSAFISQYLVLYC